MEFCIGDDNIIWENDDKMGLLVWVGDIYWCIFECWGLCGGIQYDICLDNVVISNFSIEYCWDEDCLVQLNYCYVSLEYIQVMLFKYYFIVE